MNIQQIDVLYSHKKIDEFKQNNEVYPTIIVN